MNPPSRSTTCQVEIRLLSCSPARYAPIRTHAHLLGMHAPAQYAPACSLARVPGNALVRSLICLQCMYPSACLPIYQVCCLPCPACLLAHLPGMHSSARLPVCHVCTHLVNHLRAKYASYSFADPPAKYAPYSLADPPAKYTPYLIA